MILKRYNLSNLYQDSAFLQQKKKHTYLAVWPDWAIYWTLDNFLKLLATINLHQSPPFLGNFYKGIKIIHISSETISGQLL